MEIGRAYTGCKHLKRLVILITFLLSCFNLLSLDAFVELSDTRIKRASRLILDLYVERVEGITPEIKEPEFPDILSRISGPYISPVKKESNGQKKDFWRYRYTFQGVRSGRRVLSPFTIVSGNIELKTSPLLVEVSYISDINKVSFDIEWKVPDKIYKGQSFFLVLYVKNMDKLLVPYNVSIGDFKGVFIEPSAFFHDFVENKVGDISVFDIPVRSFIVTAFDDISLPEVKISLDGVTEELGPMDITVLDSPNEISQTGAVGELEFYYDMDKIVIDENSTFSLRMTISGTGNIPYISFPEILTDDMIITKQWEDSNVVTDIAGYKGWRTRNIEFKPLKTGSIELDLPDFIYFSPEKRELKRKGGKKVFLTVRPVDTVEKDFELLDYKSVSDMDRKAYITHLYLFLALVGILALFIFLVIKKPYLSVFIMIVGILLIFIFFKYEGIDKNKIDKAYLLEQKAKYEEALSLYLSALKEKESPGLLYNAAVIYNKKHEIGRSLFFLKRAEIIFPNFPQAEALVKHIESTNNILSFKSLYVPYPVDNAFGIMFLSVYVLYILVFIYYFIKRKIYLVFILIFSTVFITSLSFCLYPSLLKNEAYAIVLENSSVYKIPDSETKKEYLLKEGSGVFIRYLHNGFYLIENNYGIEGWVDEKMIKRIIPDGEKDGRKIIF
ncbi:hypothetical protein WKV44_07445 [Spirochaetia bacterium 38H-sp]|uniref:SH3 domain-containing protein n=1 Tax=Rarispira pelagica TaxID=3141764 RepID=A0ABU9UD47_9SPIR